MMTQEPIDKQIERLQEEVALAEKRMDELSKKKDEIQEVIELLKNEKMKKDKRLQAGEIYWYVDDIGQICSKIEEYSYADNYRYENGNYFLTETEAEEDEKETRLKRLLKRFSKQNGWNDEDWKNDEWKHYIFFDYSTNVLKVGMVSSSRDTNQVYSTNVLKVGMVSSSRDTNQVYFMSEDIAQKAIEKYHDLIMKVMAI